MRYAQRFLKLYQKKAHFVESAWEMPPSGWPEEAVSATQLAELLTPGTSHLHSFRQPLEQSSEPVDLQKLLLEDCTIEE